MLTAIVLRLAGAVAEVSGMVVDIASTSVRLVFQFISLVAQFIRRVFQSVLDVVSWSGDNLRGLLGIASMVGATGLATGLNGHEPTATTVMVEASTESEWEDLRELRGRIREDAQAAAEQRGTMLSTLVDRLDEISYRYGDTQQRVVELLEGVRVIDFVQGYMTLNSALETLEETREIYERRTRQLESVGESEVAELRRELEQQFISRTAEVLHAVATKCGRVSPTCPSVDGGAPPQRLGDTPTWTEMPLAIGPTCTRSGDKDTADGGRWHCGIGLTLDLPRAIRLVR